VFFSLLTLLSVFLVARSARHREGWKVVATWSLLCVGAACAATHHIFGGPRILYSLGRWFAIAFIIAQVAQVLMGDVAGEDNVEKP
jgi:uncharacterized membrane protein YoaK (UPF0700 family)